MCIVVYYLRKKNEKLATKKTLKKFKVPTKLWTLLLSKHKKKYYHSYSYSNKQNITTIIIAAKILPVPSLLQHKKYYHYCNYHTEYITTAIIITPNILPLLQLSHQNKYYHCCNYHTKYITTAVIITPKILPVL